MANLGSQMFNKNRKAIAAATSAEDSDDEFFDCTNDFDYESSSHTKNALNSEHCEITEKSENCATKPVNATHAEGDVACVRSSVKFTKERKFSDLTDTDDSEEDEEMRKEKQKKVMDEFRKELNEKRELRQKCVQNLREELSHLREELSSEKLINEKLRGTISLHGDSKTIDNLYNENIKIKSEMAELQHNLQAANAENLTVTSELHATRDHVKSLKAVIVATKEMLSIREEQVNQLKTKLTQIEDAFTEKEMKLMSATLQQEYHRQLENIRSMRELYEQRAALLVDERDTFKQKVEDKQHDLEVEMEKNKSLEEYITTLQNNATVKSTDFAMLESELGLMKSDKLQVQSEMNAVNQLISQILLGFNANENKIDIDKLIKMLEENRDLLNEMAEKEEFVGIEEGAFLPKLLYDMFLQVNTPTPDAEDVQPECSENQKPISVEDVAEKLPKVWRVLTELLSHHKKMTEIQLSDDEKELNDCYNSIQTASGPQAVLSVSKTFVKLKDLILEKKSLQKDTNRLKTLYTHLETRLDKQEKRLVSVSLELSKTWHLVGKIKRQHRQLHTHEQILVYQLQQKRKLLNELKDELEYCRKKWAAAREKNQESEVQCRLLRQEFTKRKQMDHNSAESGYSDDHQSDDDEISRMKRMPSPSGECDGAGTSNENRFTTNLNLFERTMSPTDLVDRRNSESPCLIDLSDMIIFSRAHSEPPMSSDLLEYFNSVTEQIQLPQQLSDFDFMEESISFSQENALISTPPAVIETDSCTSNIVHVTEEAMPTKDSEPVVQENIISEPEAPKVTEVVSTPPYNPFSDIIPVVPVRSRYLVPRVIIPPKPKPVKVYQPFCQAKRVITKASTSMATLSSNAVQSKKTKKSKKSQKSESTDTKEESAEKMFARLMASMNGEEYVEQESEDEIEIEEIPESVPEIVPEIVPEVAMSPPPYEELKSKELKSIAEEDIEIELPSTSSPPAIEKEKSYLTKHEEEYMARREARLARLEADAKDFFNKMNRTKERSHAISSHLDEVHNNFMERQKDAPKPEQNSEIHESNSDKANNSQSTSNSTEDNPSSSTKDTPKEDELKDTSDPEN